MKIRNFNCNLNLLLFQSLFKFCNQIYIFMYNSIISMTLCAHVNHRTAFLFGIILRSYWIQITNHLKLQICPGLQFSPWVYTSRRMQTPPLQQFLQCKQSILVSKLTLSSRYTFLRSINFILYMLILFDSVLQTF